MTQQARVAIVGAGSMGCLFGPHLARAGVDVLLVDVDRQLVEVIDRDGVTVVWDGSEQVTRVPATADPEEHEPVAAAIVLVKGYHTGNAARRSTRSTERSSRSPGDTASTHRSTARWSIS